MRAKTLILMSSFIICVACNNKEKAMSTNELSEPESTTESLIVNPAIEENLQFNFELEKMEELIDNSSFEQLGFPENFSKADFLEKSVVIDDIEMLVGNIVEKTSTEGGNSYYRNLGVNYIKTNTGMKLKLPIDPIIYEKAFDYNTSQSLSTLIGGISNDRKKAYLFQIIDLGFISINQRGINLESLKKSMNGLSDEEKKNRYIITGIRNFVLKANTYEESRLNGNFNYAIKIGGNKYARTTEVSRTNKIAVEVTPLNEFLRLEE